MTDEQKALYIQTQKKSKMTDEQKAAFIQGQAACAMIECQGMLAANKERESRGEALAYNQKSFQNIIDFYCIHHTDVTDFYRGVGKFS